MNVFSEKYNDPRWQRKRLEIFSRDNWSCLNCGDATSELAVHHKKYYDGKEPWEYDDSNLITLCINCHEGEHEIDGSQPLARAIEDAVDKF
jgi:5-methylcytosine-specific restriction endonuclease McrA